MLDFLKLLPVRWFGLLRFDEDAIFRLATARQATWPALFGLLLASGLGGLRWLQTPQSSAQVTANATVLPGGWAGLLILLCCSLVGWWQFAGGLRFLAQFLWSAELPRIELLRLSGYSVLPLALLSLPYIGPLALLWALAALYRALRSHYSLSWAKALLGVLAGGWTAFLSWGFLMLIAATLF